MGKLGTARHAWSIIDEVDEYEADDWEETTREERAWMKTARELAVALARSTGYIRWDVEAADGS